MKEVFLSSSPCVPLAPKAIINPANGFLEKLRWALPEEPEVLYICSDPNVPEKTRYYAEEMAQAFAEAGILFGDLAVLDGENFRMAGDLIACADFIILAGGHVPTQNAFFQAIHLRELLEDFEGVILGISAGSMNCADVVYAQPEEPGEARDPSYQRFIRGLGLTELNILPHFNENHDFVLDGLHLYEQIAAPDSYGNRFLILPDGSYAHIAQGKTEICGWACWVADGEFEIFNEE